MFLVHVKQSILAVSMMEPREKIKLSQTDFLSWKFEPADIKLVRHFM